MEKPQKTKGTALQDLTTKQRLFCEYLITHQGRCTNTEAAVNAGYEPSRARIEASELMKQSHIQSYLHKRMQEVNKAYAVTQGNFIRHQAELSKKLVKEGKTEKAAAFEAMIGKAMGLFIDRKEILTRNLTVEDKMNRKEELIKQAERMRKINALIKE